MQLNITGQNVEITEALRDFVNAKFAKLEQYFERINQVYIVLKVEKVTHISDATLHVNGGTACQCGRARHVRCYRRLD